MHPRQAACRAHTMRNPSVLRHFLPVRTVLAAILCCVAALHLAALTSPAQDERWKELLTQVRQLNQRQLYSEALPVAQELLRVAEAGFGAESPQSAYVLNLLGAIYQRLGKYSDAEPLHRRALEIDERVFGKEDPSVAIDLNNLAGALQSQSKYAEAEPLYRRSLTMREKFLGPEHPEVGTALNNLASLYKAEGNYSQAEPLFKRSLAIAEKKLGGEDPDLALSLNNLADLYVALGKYAEAEPLYKRSLAIRENALGAEHPDVAQALNNLASLYDAQGRYAETEPLYTRSLAIWEKALGPEHVNVATALNNLAALYASQGSYSKAEPLFQRSLAIRQKALGFEHPDVAMAWNNLADIYQAQGRYAAAEPLYQQSAALLEKVLGPVHPDVAIALDNLAGIYDAEGRSGEAETLYKRSLAIREKALGSGHPLVGKSLNNLANLYRSLGQLSAAERLSQRSLAIREKALGPEHPDVALALHNLALLYSDEGKNAEAEPLFRRALAIAEKTLGPNHPHLATYLNSLASQYRSQGKFAEAEALFRHSLAIRETSLGPDHPDVANALNNLARLYQEQSKTAEAEQLYLRALAILEKSLGPEHPLVVTVLNNLAILHFGNDQPAQAGPLFERSLQNVYQQFADYFAFMSEKDRLQFLDLVGNLFPAYESFCFTYRDKAPALAGKLYDVVLWQKGFVASSIAALRGKIAASGEPKALALLKTLTEKRSQAAHLVRTPPSDRAEWRRSVEKLEQEADEIEKELVRRSTALAEERRLTRVSWRDVQKSLGKNDAAVEFVHFRLHDGKKWTGAYLYIALVVTPETSTAPELIFLGDAKTLESAPVVEYRRQAGLDAGSPPPEPGETKPGIYQVFWKPLEPVLRGAQRIYVSPDGVLNQLSLGVVVGEDNRMLIDRYDLRIVSTTKDILQARQNNSRPGGAAVLIGNPRFDLDENSQRAAEARAARSGAVKSLALQPTNPIRSGDIRGGGLSPLPGTKLELQTIRALLAQKQWSVEVDSEENALKTRLMGVNGPRALHLATHGFFLAEPEGSSGGVSRKASAMDDPMLRAGLFFAGANRAISGKPSAPGLDDGILTAYEATGLNLHGTELVVLSACETGLGQTKSGEGVFGLRRAFQEAGAEAVLMSMWSVPDRETKELMARFYQKWLAGKEKHLALRQAQLEMREVVKKRYGIDLPFYWGAFVLVGR